jgi:hypothetical protein
LLDNDRALSASAHRETWLTSFLGLIPLSKKGGGRCFEKGEKVGVIWHWPAR